mgnify:CR=1 FL=1
MPIRCEGRPADVYEQCAKSRTETNDLVSGGSGSRNGTILVFFPLQVVLIVYRQQHTDPTMRGMEMKNIIKAIAVTSLLAIGLNVNADEHDGAMKKDIVDTAVGADDFNTLVTAVQAADLVETLKGDGPFTVFAPTDEAFAAIPESDLEALLADKDQLTAVLTYHVVSGKVMAEDVVGLDSATTVQGSDVDIEVVDGSVMIDGATVVTADIEASNGVIHVIDGVLLP